MAQHLQHQKNRIYPNKNVVEHFYRTSYNKSINSSLDPEQDQKIQHHNYHKQMCGLQPAFDLHYFQDYLFQMEVLARLVGVNLLQKEFLPKDGRNSTEVKNMLISLCRTFLLIYMIEESICTSAIIYNGAKEYSKSEDEKMLMLYMGDFFVLFGVHVDPLSLHAFKLCWGFHAIFIYFWITSYHGKIRKWLLNFDRLYMETAYYVNKDLEPESRRRMYKGTCFARLFIQWCTILATGTITALGILGYFTEEGKRLFNHYDYYNYKLSLVIYIVWTIIHTIWFWLTFIINLTAFGHHFLLCRAIHIRFEETKNDLEYAVLSERSVYTQPEHLSGLIIKHYYVCDMVKQANKHLKIYLFIFYVIFAPHLCFMIYQIIFSTNFTAQGRILLGFMLILCDFFQVYSVSVLSAQITSKSHEPYYAMHGVNKFDNLPESIQLQSTLFMQRISNTVIGLTILDSFVLTGGLISSMLTAIITYFSVILENS